MPLAIDYTAITETDPNDRFQNVTSTSFDVVLLNRNDPLTRFFDDFGVDFFGDLPLGITWDAQADSGDNPSTINMLAMDANNDTYRGHVSASTPAWYVQFNGSTGGGVKIFLQEMIGNSTDAFVFTYGVRYWFTFTRSSITGTLKIYTDSGRTVLVDTIGVTRTGMDATLRYLTVCSQDDINQDREMSGSIANHVLEDSEGAAAAMGRRHPIYMNDVVW